jgi:hypothetical protein
LDEEEREPVTALLEPALVKRRWMVARPDVLGPESLRFAVNRPLIMQLRQAFPDTFVLFRARPATLM